MADPEFLTPEGERAWTWLRRHLDRANTFWLAFVLTDDLATQRVLRNRVRANRRLRAHPLTVLEPTTPAELASLLDELEARGATPPGCTWVAASRLADEDWLAAWRVFLLTMNHRRDVLRARLGGLVITAPPAVKVIAQRQSPDLWSVRDLLIELAPRPVITRSSPAPREAGEPRQAYRATGLSYESDDAELAQEAQVLLAMPVAELAGPARDRVSRAVHRAAAQGANQLAAVLLLALSDGYRTAGDPAGALNLVQDALTLTDVEPQARERLLNSGMELARIVSELELAREYAAELVTLTERRATPIDELAQRDLSINLRRLGDITRDIGDPATAATHYRQAFDIAERLDMLNPTPQHRRNLSSTVTKLGDVTRDLGETAGAIECYFYSLGITRRLAEELGTAQDLHDLSSTLTKLGDVTRDLGDLATAANHYRQALDTARRLAEELGTPQALHDLSISHNRLGDLARWLGDPATAATHHQQALDITRRLAEQLGTARALRGLRAGLNDLARTEEELGNADAAAALRAELATVENQLAPLSDEPSDSPGHPTSDPR